MTNQSVIWARSLTSAEEEYIRHGKYSKDLEINFLEQIAIMGPAKHPYICSLNVRMFRYRVDLGGGDYIDEYLGGGAALGGVKVPVVREISYRYLVNAANELNIPFVYHPDFMEIIYFPSVYIEAFIKGFSYADHALARGYKNDSILSRWFGAKYPDWGTRESKIIVEDVRKILIGESS